MRALRRIKRICNCGQFPSPTGLAVLIVRQRALISGSAHERHLLGLFPPIFSRSLLNSTSDAAKMDGRCLRGGVAPREAFLMKPSPTPRRMRDGDERRDTAGAEGWARGFLSSFCFLSIRRAVSGISLVEEELGAGHGMIETGAPVPQTLENRFLSLPSNHPPHVPSPSPATGNFRAGALPPRLSLLLG